MVTSGSRNYNFVEVVRLLLLLIYEVDHTVMLILSVSIIN